MQEIKAKLGLGMIFVLGILLLAQTGFAQEDIVTDTTKQQLTPKQDKRQRRKQRRAERRQKKLAKRDSTWKPLRIAGIRFGADVLPTIFGVLDETRTSYQGTFELLLNNKYSIELSGGTDQVTRLGAGTYRYNSQGFFGRLGINYNLLHKQSDDDLIYVGLHFGYAQFDNDIQYSIVNPLGNADNFTAADEQLNGTWLEFNFGFRIELFKNFYMGPMFRVKSKLSGSEGDRLTPNDIPGYGVNNGANFAFGYHLLYRIPFTSKKKTSKKSSQKILQLNPKANIKKPKPQKKD